MRHKDQYKWVKESNLGRPRVLFLPLLAFGGGVKLRGSEKELGLVLIFLLRALWSFSELG